MTAWPSLPYRPWQGTAEALHLFCQIAGKYRLAHTPWINHSWHATLYPTPRGLTTGLIADPAVPTEVAFDFVEGAVLIHAAGGASGRVPLQPMSVAAFHGQFVDAVRAVGGTAAFHGTPSEIADAIAFADDTALRPFDMEAVRRWHRAMLSITGVFERFRSSWLGKVSPVHLFWGSFDLAVTRFSGRDAPRHPGGIPGLPDAVTWEAYSHEVASAGFWPGGAGAEEAMFYAYAYPTPPGFADQPIAPDAAFFDTTLGEFLLPYAAVAGADDPDAALMAFVTSAYRAAAVAGDWPAAAFETAIGQPRVPRAVV